MSWNPWSTASAETPEEAEEAATPESSESALATARTAALPLRAVTRATSRTISSSSDGRTDGRTNGHLAAPTPQELLRRISRSRSPSPSPTPTTSSTLFAFPTTSAAAAMDEEMVARITANAIKMALAEDRAERDRQSALHTEAAVSAALSQQSNQVRALRKPDLPPLDKKHIEQWIQRVEYAYTRAEVNKAKDKFAFLESKFSGCDDAQINEMLQGVTDAQWTAFLDHLRDTYGRTKKDMVNALLNGFPRESRRPQQLASHIRERIGNITLDDILKEILLREIPPEIRQHAATSTKTLDFQKTADHLEVYFDKQGKVLDASRPLTGINHVASNQQQPRASRPLQPALKTESHSSNASAPSTHSSEQSTYTGIFSEEDDNTDVNAVRFRPNGQRQQFNVSNRSQSRGRTRNASSNNNNSNNNNNNNNNNGRSFNNSNNGSNPSRYSSSSSNNNNNNNNSRYNNNSRDASSSRSEAKVCSFHVQYGDKARSCREGCMMYAQHQAKGQASR